MRRWLGLAAVVASISGATRAPAATVSVTITGLAQVGYELTVAGVRRTGWLAASPGPSTVKTLVDIDNQETVTATLTFLGSAGVLAACPAVQVRLQNQRTSCEPTFVLTGKQDGLQRYECRARCEPRRETQKSSEEEEEEEWIYAAGSVEGEPLVDGWPAAGSADNRTTQSFYMRSMSGAPAYQLYSATVAQ